MATAEERWEAVQNPVADVIPDQPAPPQAETKIVKPEPQDNPKEEVEIEAETKSEVE